MRLETEFQIKTNMVECSSRAHALEMITAFTTEDESMIVNVNMFLDEFTEKYYVVFHHHTEDEDDDK